jgi:hypothetical protein
MGRFSAAVGDHAIAAAPLGLVERGVGPLECGVQLFFFPVGP